MPINQSGLSVNVRVSVSNNRITDNNVNLDNNRIIFPSTSPVKTVKSQFNSVDTVSELTDVEGTPQDGFTLVYDSILQKYVLQQLSSEEINITSIDGGTF
jgi:hypothetical protein